MSQSTGAVLRSSNVQHHVRTQLKAHSCTQVLLRQSKRPMKPLTQALSKCFCHAVVLVRTENPSSYQACMATATLTNVNELSEHKRRRASIFSLRSSATSYGIVSMVGCDIVCCVSTYGGERQRFNDSHFVPSHATGQSVS